MKKMIDYAKYPQWKLVALLTTTISIFIAIIATIFSAFQESWALPAYIFFAGICLSTYSYVQKTTINVTKEVLNRNTKNMYYGILALLVCLLFLGTLIAGIFLFKSLLKDKDVYTYNHNSIELKENKNIFGPFFSRDSLYFNHSEIRITAGILNDNEYLFQISDIAKIVFKKGLTCNSMSIKVKNRWSTFNFNFRNKNIYTDLPEIIHSEFGIQVEKETSILGYIKDIFD